MKVVYARADKVPNTDNQRQFTETRYYPCTDHGDWFAADDDNGKPCLRDWGEYNGWHWTRIEHPYRDPKAVEDLIAAVEEGLAHGFTASRWIDVNATHARLSPAALGGE